MTQSSLNELERDFIEFMARENNAPLARIEAAYLKTKAEFDFGSPEFARLMARIQYLHRLEYDNFDDASSMRSYRHWGLLSVLRQLSYSFPAAKPKRWQILKKALTGGEFKLIGRALARRLTGKSAPPPANEPAMGRYLAGLIEEEPVVLDYGCGLAYISFEIGRIRPESRFILVDVDCLGLRFTEYRFKKYGLSVETVVISEDEPYPSLPAHNICIATDVMEHLWNPEAAYDNIVASLAPAGVLYGQFQDFKPGFWHVTADLSPIRARLAEDFTPLQNNCFRKRG